MLQLATASVVAPIDKLSVACSIALGMLVLGEPLSWQVRLTLGAACCHALFELCDDNDSRTYGTCMDSTKTDAAKGATAAECRQSRTLKRTPRSKLKRLPRRGHYDFETVAAILDSGFLCHVGYVVDGTPLVTPTAYWREGRRVYWHGSHASRMLNTAATGVPVCLTVAHVDGLVMARSAFHCSINYRSAMLMGTANVITESDEKKAALKEFVNRMSAGRWDALRPVTNNELKATTVLWMDIEEGSAKVRTGPPLDDEDDYELRIWAGVVPIRMVAGHPVDDPRLAGRMTAPAAFRDLTHLGLARK